MKMSSHAWVGISLALAFVPPTQQALLACAVGSVAPDFGLYFSNMVHFRQRTLLTSYREITHHVILGLVMILATLLINNPIYTYFTIGYISHLVIDSLSYLGIPYWHYQNRISLRIYQTGKISEFIVCFLVVATMYALFKDHSIAFLQLLK